MIKIKRFFKRVEVSFMLLFGIIKLWFRLWFRTFKFMWEIKKVEKDLPSNDRENG